MPDNPKNPKLKHVKNLELRGMEITRSWADMWHESLEYFFGAQLKGKKAHKDWDWVVLNYIWPAAIQEISKLARRVPKIIAEPWDSTDHESSEVWQGILQWLARNGLNEHGMQIEQIKSNLDAKLFGYRVYKVYWEDKCYWDDRTQQWVGDVKGKLWHPAHFWANDSENVQNGSVGTLRYVELEYAKGRWPKFASVFEEEAREMDQMENDFSSMGGITVRGQDGNSGTYPAAGTGGTDKGVESQLTTRILNQVEGVKSYAQGELKYVELHEAYYRDNTEENIKNEELIPAEELIESGRAYNDNGSFIDSETRLPFEADSWPTRVTAEYKKPKYPHGRYVLWCGETILNADNQIYPYTKWPFIVAPHYLLPHMWQGTDAVQMYKSTQDMINVTVSHLVNNMKFFGDPKIAVESGALESPKGRDQKHFSIGKGAGRIIRLVRGGLKKFKILDPVSPSASHSQLYTLFSQEFKNQVGLQDISQGKAANTTATEATFLVQSANDRILLQSVFEEQFLREIMSMAGEICQHNYDEGRMVRIVGENNLPGITQIAQREKEVRFDVHIEVGSTLPYDDERRIAKYKEAYGVLSNPIANPMTPEMLQVLEIPNWKKLLDRYEAYQVYAQYLQIFDAVREGQLDPVSAMKQLNQIAMQALQPFMMKEIQGRALDSAAQSKGQEDQTGNAAG